MEEIDYLRKKLKKEAEELYDIDEDSDIPVRERLAKDRKLRKA